MTQMYLYIYIYMFQQGSCHMLPLASGLVCHLVHVNQNTLYVPAPSVSNEVAVDNELTAPCSSVTLTFSKKQHIHLLIEFKNRFKKKKRRGQVVL